jgi:hypothetical protein
MLGTFLVKKVDYEKHHVRRVYCLPVVGAGIGTTGGITKIMVDVTNDLQLEVGNTLTILICNQVNSNDPDIRRDFYIGAAGAAGPLLEDYDFTLTGKCWYGPGESESKDSNFWLSAGGLLVWVSHKSKDIDRINIEGNIFYVLIKKEPKLYH